MVLSLRTFCYAPGQAVANADRTVGQSGRNNPSGVEVSFDLGAFAARLKKCGQTERKQAAEAWQGLKPSHVLQHLRHY